MALPMDSTTRTANDSTSILGGRRQSLNDIRNGPRSFQRRASRTMLSEGISSDLGGLSQNAKPLGSSGFRQSSILFQQRQKLRRMSVGSPVVSSPLFSTKSENTTPSSSNFPDRKLSGSTILEDKETTSGVIRKDDDRQCCNNIFLFSDTRQYQNKEMRDKNKDSMTSSNFNDPHESPSNNNSASVTMSPKTNAAFESLITPPTEKQATSPKTPGQFGFRRGSYSDMSTINPDVLTGSNDSASEDRNQKGTSSDSNPYSAGVQFEIKNKTMDEKPERVRRRSKFMLKYDLSNFPDPPKSESSTSSFLSSASNDEQENRTRYNAREMSQSKDNVSTQNKKSMARMPSSTRLSNFSSHEDTNITVDKNVDSVSNANQTLTTTSTLFGIDISMTGTNTNLNVRPSFDRLKSNEALNRDGTLTWMNTGDNQRSNNAFQAVNSNSNEGLNIPLSESSAKTENHMDRVLNDRQEKNTATGLSYVTDSADLFHSKIISTMTPIAKTEWKTSQCDEFNKDTNESGSLHINDTSDKIDNNEYLSASQTVPLSNSMRTFKPIHTADVNRTFNSHIHKNSDLCGINIYSVDRSTTKYEREVKPKSFEVNDELKAIQTFEEIVEGIGHYPVIKPVSSYVGRDTHRGMKSPLRFLTRRQSADGVYDASNFQFLKPLQSSSISPSTSYRNVYQTGAFAVVDSKSPSSPSSSPLRSPPLRSSLQTRRSSEPSDNLATSVEEILKRDTNNRKNASPVLLSSSPSSAFMHVSKKSGHPIKPNDEIDFRHINIAATTSPTTTAKPLRKSSSSSNLRYSSSSSSASPGSAEITSTSIHFRFPGRRKSSSRRDSLTHQFLSDGLLVSPNVKMHFENSVSDIIKANSVSNSVSFATTMDSIKDFTYVNKQLDTSKVSSNTKSVSKAK